MATNSSPDLHDFYVYLQETISRGGPLPSPEEALDSWRFAHPNPEDELAVQAALDALDQGEVGLPLEQFDLEFRRRNGLPTR